MTEAEWLACDDPARMLEALASGTAPWHAVASVTPGGIPRVIPPSDHKLRLFACATARLEWGELSEYPRSCIRSAERAADGKREKTRMARAAHSYMSWTKSVLAKEMVALGCCLESAQDAAMAVLREIGAAGLSGKRQAAASLMRDIVGNPFRPVTLPRLCWDGKVYDSCQNCKRVPCVCQNHCQERQACPWLTGTVLSLAQAAYDERGPHGTLDAFRLAVLSDALEEAGCTDEAILSHLRSGGPHVRGCWAVDLILGRE
jgi:hypothetical protein